MQWIWIYYPSLLQHFKECSWDKWFLGAQSRRSFTLLSFTSTLPVQSWSPAHTFIAMQAAAGVSLRQPGGCAGAAARGSPQAA